MVWRPGKALGLIIGLLIVLTMLAIEGLLINGMIGQAVSLSLYLTALLTMLSSPFLVLWIYWYVCLLTLTYRLDRNVLTIVCGAVRYQVPLVAVERVLPGHEVMSVKGFTGVGWPGFLMGRMRVRDLAPLLVLSTEPLERQLIVVTDSQCYGISPRLPQQFLADLAAHSALGPIRPAEHRRQVLALAALPLWRDASYWGLLLLASVANIVLWGYLVARYPGLPERMALHFGLSGEADHIGPRSSALMIPAIGTFIWVANCLVGALLHTRERLGAFLAALTALAVQAVLWYAMIGIA